MKTTEGLTIEHAGAMPAATWHFLKMNDTAIEIPAGLAISPAVEFAGAQRDTASGRRFEHALENAQQKWEKLHPAPTAEEIADREAYLAAEADATYGGTAQSAYQARADELEDARSLSMAFEHGVGAQAAEFLAEAAGDPFVICAGAGQTIAAQAIVTAASGALSAAAIDIVADRNSTVSLSLVVDDASESDSAELPAVAGTTLRVFADEGSHVDIVRTQTLGAHAIDIDDAGIFAAEGARVNVRQTVLGAGRAFTGLATDLRGDSSRIDIATGYLGSKDQERDFNYVVRHHGRRTECDLKANGVLCDASKKTLRGTIELNRGAKGASGSENETVLLIDEGVRNKTVPIILCNEDDVSGTHGATIGHIREDQLFYLASRGLDRRAAELMLAGAFIEQSALDAPDDIARAAVVRLGEQRIPGFSERFEEED